MLKKEVLVAFIDGACFPNPGGEMGVGAYVLKNGERIFEYSSSVNPHKGNSNNVAEYLALIAVLDYLVDNQSDIEIYSDSNLLVNQMRGRWRILNGMYLNYALEAKEKLSKLNGVALYWIPREENEEADRLSKKEMSYVPEN